MSRGTAASSLVRALITGVLLLAVRPALAQPPAPRENYDALLERLARAESDIEALKRQPRPISQAGFETTVDGPSLADDVTGQQPGAFERQFQELQEAPAKPTFPTVEVHGAFQVDTGWFNQDATSRATVGDIQDGASFRRARLSANGAVVENMNYFFQMDFAFPGRPTFTDVWMELTKVPVLGNVRVGQWKQPFSLEVVSSYRYTTFPERSVLFQSFTPFRHVGIGFYDHAEDEMMTWAASVYRSGQDQYGDSIADNGGYAGVGRLTSLAWYDEGEDGITYLHLGGAYNYVAPNNANGRFRTIPEYFVGDQAGAIPVGTAGVAIPGPFNGVPFFVDTLAFGIDHYNLLGSEVLFVDGPVSLQSEFMYLSATRTNNVGATFAGFYTQLGYFLTGEHRPYNRKLGAIDRIIPKHNVGFDEETGYGTGAWEIACRWSYIDLNSKDIQGGRLYDFTAGLNWYLNANSKIQFNYIRAMLASPTHGNSDTNIFGLRAQVDF